MAETDYTPLHSLVSQVESSHSLLEASREFERISSLEERAGQSRQVAEDIAETAEGLLEASTLFAHNRMPIVGLMIRKLGETAFANVLEKRAAKLKQHFLSQDDS